MQHSALMGQPAWSCMQRPLLMRRKAAKAQWAWWRSCRFWSEAICVTSAEPMRCSVPEYPAVHPTVATRSFCGFLGERHASQGKDVQFPTVDWVGTAQAGVAFPQVRWGQVFLLCGAVSCRHTTALHTGAACGAPTDCPTASTARSAAVKRQRGRGEVRLWEAGSALHIVAGGWVPTGV